MNRRAWLLMALLAALWGASYLFIKVSLEDGVDPVFIVFARIALGAIVLVPLAMRGAGMLRQMRGLAGPILFLAIVQVVLPFALITYGEQHIASALTGILVSSAPIFTALIAARFDDDERPHGVATAGVVMGIVGVVLLFGVDLSGDAQALAGGLMVLLASVGYAVGSLFLKHRLRGVPPVGVAASTMLAGTIVLLPFVPFTLPSDGARAADRRRAARARRRRDGDRVRHLLHPDRRDRPRPGVARRVHRAGLRRALRRDAAQRAADGRRDPRPDPHPRGLVGRGGGPLAGPAPGGARRSAGTGPADRPCASRPDLAEADLAVGARPRLRALDEVQPLDRGAEQAGDEAHARVLGAQVEQALLGVEAEVDRRRHRVGGLVGELVGIGLVVGRLDDELGVGGAGGLGGARVDAPRPCRRGTRPSPPDRACRAGARRSETGACRA